MDATLKRYNRDNKRSHNLMTDKAVSFPPQTNTPRQHSQLKQQQH